MSYVLAASILAVSFALCVYLLTLLWHIHHVHSSAAWKFIFFGLTLLLVECAIGFHLVVVQGRMLGLEETIFIATMMVKAVCYAIGFSIWKRDIDWLKTLAKHRREHMEDERDKPQQPPEHPLPPTQPPQPGGPTRPTDEPQPPGDPQGPGKGGGGGD